MKRYADESLRIKTKPDSGPVRTKYEEENNMRRREVLEREYGALNDERIRLERKVNFLYNFETLNAEEQKAVDDISRRLMEIDQRMNEIESDFIFGDDIWTE